MNNKTKQFRKNILQLQIWNRRRTRGVKRMNPDQSMNVIISAISFINDLESDIVHLETTTKIPYSIHQHLDHTQMCLNMLKMDLLKRYDTLDTEQGLFFCGDKK